MCFSLFLCVAWLSSASACMRTTDCSQEQQIGGGTWMQQEWCTSDEMGSTSFLLHRRWNGIYRLTGMQILDRLQWTFRLEVEFFTTRLVIFLILCLWTMYFLLLVYFQSSFNKATNWKQLHCLIFFLCLSSAGSGIGKSDRKGPKNGWLFPFFFTTPPRNKALFSFGSSMNKECQFWHKRLGHLNS